MDKNNSDHVAAALSFATNLHEQLMPKTAPQATQAPQTLETAPQEPQQAQQPQDQTQGQNDAKLTELEAKMDKMKVEMESMMKGEISSVKDIIIEALNKDEQQGQT